MIVNIWTSRNNKALPGVNVGHVSLTTSSSHICLWPGEGDILKDKTNVFFKSKEPKVIGSNPNYELDYEGECLRETKCENAEYELSLFGYQVYKPTWDSEIGENKLYVETAYTYMRWSSKMIHTS